MSKNPKLRTAADYGPLKEALMKHINICHPTNERGLYAAMACVWHAGGDDERKAT